MVQAVLVSPVILPAGCGVSWSSAVDVTALDAPLFSGSALALGGLKPAQAVDYIELRNVAIGANSVTGTISSTRATCESATNPSACDAAVTNPTAPSGETGIYTVYSQICTHGALITTRVDEVKAIASKAALDAFLAPLRHRPGGRAGGAYHRPDGQLHLQDPRGSAPGGRWL